MAEDIKEEENSEKNENEEISDGLIPEDGDEPTANENDSSEEENTTEESPKEEETPTQTVAETPSAQEETEEENEIVDDDENPIQQKQTKIQKILMIVVGVLAGILVLGFVLYLFGVFDPEEPVKPVMTPEMIADMNQTKEPEKYMFDAKDINIDRLNGKLRILTKYEIIGTEEEERQKELEKNSKLSTAQINELLNAEQIELDKKKKEEDQAKKAESERKKQEALKKADTKKQKTERPYDLLKFIQVSDNDSLLSSINTEVEKFKVATSKCSDNSQEFFLIGPFKSLKELNQAFRAIYNNVTQSTTKKDLARLEFNRICK